MDSRSKPGIMGMRQLRGDWFPKIRERDRKMDMENRVRITRGILARLSLCLIAILFAACASGNSGAGPGDATWAPYETREALDRDDIENRAFYLTMRDGIQIAVDLYLPKERTQGQAIPTIFHATRYFRAVDLSWPFSWLQGGPSETIRRIVANGYAYVSIDSRGSGASFGYRPSPWSPDEVADFGEVFDWIVAQDWSDGKIGATGISYDGTTAEMAGVTGHPALKAIIPQFSLYDAYSDIGFPGGIQLAHFTEGWAFGNDLMDRNSLDEVFPSPIQKWALKGVKPVDEDLGGEQLRAAVESHRFNYNPHEVTMRVKYRDDFAEIDPALDLNVFSPYGHAEKFRETGVPIYSYSGWRDGAYSHAAIKRYLNVKNPGSKMTLGPWNHGGSQNASPSVLGDSNFDRVAELIRFFDRHLKGIENGIDGEAPVHYYTMGEEAWKSADSWPPPAEQVAYYFKAEGGLSAELPGASLAADIYEVDYKTRTPSISSRWHTLLGGFHVVYPDRASEDEKALTYTTAPLAADLEVTGHPIVSLNVASTASDGYFIAYLEDVDPEGVVTYVTEGQIRSVHRKISEDAPFYEDVVPHHSYLRKDRAPMIPGEAAEIVFDMIPTSYQFMKGHRIRIALVGADAEHFFTPLFRPPTWQVFRCGEAGSKIVLPVVR